MGKKGVAGNQLVGRRGWARILLFIGAALGIIALLVPWGTMDDDGARVHAWGVTAPFLDLAQSQNWFSAELREATDSGLFYPLVGFVLLACGIALAALAALAAIARAQGGAVSLGAGAFPFLALGTAGLFIGVRGLMADLELDAAFGWSSGIYLMVTATILALVGTTLVQPERSEAREPHDYAAGMRVGTSHGEGTIVNVDRRHVYVKLDGKDEPWRFRPDDVQLVVATSKQLD